VVTRTYYATGALKSEVQSAANGSAPYTHTFGYDRLGRRTWYRVGSATSNDSVWYSYAPSTGDLTAVGVRWSSGVQDSVRFWWDALGRRDTVRYTNQTKVQFAYDAHGALRLVCAEHPGGPQFDDVFDFTIYAQQVDEDGLVQTLRANNTVPGQGQIPGCGANSTMDWVQVNTFDMRHQLKTQQVLGQNSTFTYDSSGNVVRIQTGTIVDRQYTIAAAHNRITQMDDLTASNNYRKVMRYDGEGARSADSVTCTGCDPAMTFLRYYYYDGLGRTSGVRTRSGPSWIGSTNSCQYDPLGRLHAPCDNQSPRLGYDGDNVTRTQPDGNGSAWTFVHGPGTDDPLMGYYKQSGHYVYWVTDGQGRQYAVGWTSGTDYSAEAPYVNLGGKFAGGITNAHTFAALRYPNTELPDLGFFRNRFYDLESGRWTQEDPIGFAGGFNLYAYVGVNSRS
jgi:RHS repeat-associated protein